MTFNSLETLKFSMFLKSLIRHEVMKLNIDILE